MSRHTGLNLLVFALVAVVLGYLVFGGYIFAVALKTARLNQTDPQAEFITLMEQETQSLKDHYLFFWPSWPDESDKSDVDGRTVSAPIQKPTPIALAPIEEVIPTPPALGTISTQDSYGFHRECNPDPERFWRCVCEDYNFTIHIEQVRCGKDLCDATITFTNEYGDGTTMWVDYFDTETSILIHSGDTVPLPDINDHEDISWGIGSALPFFDPEEK